MQRLQTRFYSISSSPLPHPKSIHVTCAVVLETTATGVAPKIYLLINASCFPSGTFKSICTALCCYGGLKCVNTM